MTLKAIGISLFLFFIVYAQASSSWTDENVLKRQQELYSQEQWNAFFGTTLYFKFHHPNSRLKDHVLALELLALARHCQWELIHKQLEPSVSGPLANEAMIYIKQKKEYVAFINNIKNQVLPLNKTIEDQKNQWPIQIEDLTKITTPESLGMRIKSRCKN